ncbi:MAG TPA: hypothetical protein VMU11_04375 [Verrucomicrobiae bacterium]|nr:hypothetical protein [Verrucomicrobiae bacterium]
MSDLPMTPKKSVRRRKASSTPIPTGPGSSGATCGHDGSCSANNCQVTYAGPVSRMQDHHMVVAARNTSHIWPAAVITSLALLVTGSLAFSSVQAAQDAKTAALEKQAANRADIDRIVQQLNRIEAIVTETRDAVKTQPTPRQMMDGMNGLPKANDVRDNTDTNQ